MENRNEFFEWLLTYPELLDQNYVSIDLLSHLREEQILEVDYRLRELILASSPNIGIALYSCFEYEASIREKRYLTILTDEWSRIKREIGLYLILNNDTEI